MQDLLAAVHHILGKNTRDSMKLQSHSALRTQDIAMTEESCSPSE